MASRSITPRDTQRQKIYDAERIAFNGGIEETYSPPDYRTVAEVQAYVDHVTASDTWKALGFSQLGMFESHPLTVKDGRGRRRGAADAVGNTIKVPRFARRRWYMMHELAHIATAYIYNFYYDEDDEEGGGWPGYKDPETGLVMLTQNVASHGPEFAGIYLYLLRGIMGAETHDKLQAAFEETRVKVAKVAPVEVAATDTSFATVPVIDTLPPVTDTNTPHCEECGMVLSSGRSMKRFCSDRCRWTYHNRVRSRPLEERVCEVCGADFTAKRSDAKTCSPRCRQRARRRRVA